MSEMREVMAEEMCAMYIKKSLNEIEKNRVRALINAKSGARLRRDAYTSLNEKGILQTDHLIKEFERIQNKESELASGERDFVSSIVKDAIFKTLVYLDKNKKGQS